MMKISIKSLVDKLLIIPFIAILGCILVPNETSETYNAELVMFNILLPLTIVSSMVSFQINKNIVKFNSIDFLFFLFVCIGLIISLIQVQYWNIRMVTLVMLTILYFCFRVFLNQHQDNKLILISALIVIGLIEGIWGLLQLYNLLPSYNSNFKATGSFSNPGPFGGFLSLILPISVFFIFEKQNKLIRLLSISTVIIIITTLPATLSRASWLAAFAGSIFVIFFRIKSSKIEKKLLKLRRFKISRIVPLFTCLMIVGVIVVTKIYELKKPSADGRQLIWKISTNSFADNFFGAGLGHFSGNYGELQAKYFDSGEGNSYEMKIAGAPEYAFNEYIQILIEWGAIPLFLFITILLLAGYLGIKNKNFAETGSLLALIIFAFFSYPFSIISFMIVLVLLITGMTSIKVIEDSEQKKHVNKFLTYTLLITMSICFILFLEQQINRFKAYQSWTVARTYYRTYSFTKAEIYYRPLLHYLKDQPHFLFEYGQILSKLQRFSESNYILSKATLISSDPMLYIILGKNRQATKEYDKAKFYYLKAANIIPHKLYPSYLLIKLYQEMGDFQNAQKLAQTTLTKEVKVTSPAVDQMKSELQKIITNKP